MTGQMTGHDRSGLRPYQYEFNPQEAPKFDPEAPGLSSESDIVKSILFSMTKRLFMSLSFDDARTQ